MRTAVRASAALRTVPVRHKFQHIVKYGQVGSTDRQRVPTLRQLLTHLQEKEHPILTARKAMERGKRKVLRKPKRLTNDVFYDSKHLVAMDEFRAEIAAVMQKDTSQAQVILVRVQGGIPLPMGSHACRRISSAS